MKMYHNGIQDGLDSSFEINKSDLMRSYRMHKKWGRKIKSLEGLANEILVMGHLAHLRYMEPKEFTRYYKELMADETFKDMSGDDFFDVVDNMIKMPEEEFRTIFEYGIAKFIEEKEAEAKEDWRI